MKPTQHAINIQLFIQNIPHLQVILQKLGKSIEQKQFSSDCNRIDMNIEMKNHLFYQIVIYYQNWKYQEKEDYLQKYNFDNFIQVCMDGFMYGYHKIHSILN